MQCVAFMIIPIYKLIYILNWRQQTMTNMTRRIEKTTKRNRLDWEEAAELQVKKRKGEDRKKARALHVEAKRWSEEAI